MKKTLIATAVGMTLCVPALAATEFTGDKIDGVPVISKLDVSDLAAGKTHRFFFKGSENGIGETFYVPVVVAKGAKDGKKLVLNSGNHGDEVNGVRVVQKVMAGIDPQKLTGTVIGVTGSNPNAINRITREWEGYNDGGFSQNFNRLFPGKADGTAQEQHAYRMWNNLWKGNADVLIDMHTQSTGTTFPLFIYADYRNPVVVRMAELFPADQIKKDPGEKGSTETEFVSAGLPAMTVELGNPRAFDPDMVSRGVEGTRNVMIDFGMISGKIGRTTKTQKTYFGNDMANVRATQGGYAEVLVKLGDDVKKGQKVAVQLNRFGDVVKEYTAPVDGKVLSTGSDAVREARGLLVRILTRNPDPKCDKGC
ncbi:M14 family metallopeptidase [Laribacter hongkongensis]|uniref:M14 family metallopeptidase n=1 Tax=Laribacter hongkongensis TaxID=168471 RepID=UPI001EFEEC09|nr:succinylglutamate desuccinylase/aspartoacylase family protein [Laribacter hongkongensis]MCG9081486.1 succinylglutamate desuccinylase/aspartoacylase family protein [Laribacter hongkongensis]